MPARSPHKINTYYAPGMRGFNNVSSSKNGSRPKRNFTRAKVLLFLLITGFILGHIGWSKHVSAEASAKRAATAQVTAAARVRVATFANQVNTLISDNSQITFSVAVADPLTGAHVYGSTNDFDGASTGKLLTAADYLHHVEIGSVTLNTHIDGSSAHSLLQAMIVNSDDNAWASLNDYLGHDDLSQYATTNGFLHYDSSTNAFTAADVTNMLAALQGRSLLNSADRSLLLGYMQQANYRQYIVPAVPNGDTVYHKIGLDADEVNDAAIISRGDQSFEITIFTNGNGTYDWLTRARLMQTITKDALAAFLPQD